jgi:toxin ParE1/3/4
MPAVHRSPLALADLDAIWDHIAKQSVLAADRMLQRINDRCELLATHPEMGEVQPELAPALRSFHVASFVILFRPTSDGIEVARVIHGSRDIESLF